MTRKLNYFGFILALILVSGCASLNAPKPANLEQNLVYAQGGLESAYDAVTILVKNGSITKAKATDLLMNLDKGTVALVAAKSMARAGDTTQATSNLAYINQILLLVNEALKASKGSQ